MNTNIQPGLVLGGQVTVSKCCDGGSCQDKTEQCDSTSAKCCDYGDEDGPVCCEEDGCCTSKGCVAHEGCMPLDECPEPPTKCCWKQCELLLKSITLKNPPFANPEKEFPFEIEKGTQYSISGCPQWVSANDVDVDKVDDVSFSVVEDPNDTHCSAELNEDDEWVITNCDDTGPIKIRFEVGDCYLERWKYVGCGGGCNGDTCSVGGGDAGVSSVDVRISMGRGSQGTSAGEFVIREEEASAAMYSAASLKYSVAGLGVEVIYDEDSGVLSQVKGPEGLGDVDEGDCSYTISFYKGYSGSLSGDFYPTLGYSPDYQWFIGHPDYVIEGNSCPGSLESETELVVVQYDSANTTTLKRFDYDYNSSGSTYWGLTRVDPSDDAHPPSGTSIYSYESLTKTTEGGDPLEIYTLRPSSGGSAVYKESRLYHDYSGYEKLIRLIVDPDGAALTTSKTYTTGSDGKHPNRYHAYAKRTIPQNGLG